MLLLGPSGSGKSDLLLRLLDHGFTLVADDRVEIEEGVARPAERLAGLLEVRGLGIVRLPHVPAARLWLAVRLGTPERLPPRGERHPSLGLPLVTVDPALPSAPHRVAMALDCALGRLRQEAGVFA